jgi:hypothetical protein
MAPINVPWYAKVAARLGVFLSALRAVLVCEAICSPAVLAEFVAVLAGLATTLAL